MDWNACKGLPAAMSALHWPLPLADCAMSCGTVAVLGTRVPAGVTDACGQDTESAFSKPAYMHARRAYYKF